MPSQRPFTIRPYRESTDRAAVEAIFGDGMRTMADGFVRFTRLTALHPAGRARTAAAAAAMMALCVALLPVASLAARLAVFAALAVGAAAAVWTRMVRFSAWYVQQQLRDDMRDIAQYYQEEGGRGGFWVAVAGDGGEILGHAAVDHRTMGERGSAEVRRVSVAPAARGMGVATALMRHAIEHCRASGFDRVELSTSTLQDGALRMYLGPRMGFRVVAVVLAPMWFPPVPIYFLELPLRQGVPPALPPGAIDVKGRPSGGGGRGCCDPKQE